MARIITDLLDRTTKRYPQKMAFADENTKLSFAEVREYAYKIATKLIYERVFHESIAVYMDKCADEIVCFMGVAYSGNFYTPIDSEMPLVRTQKIIDLLSPKCIITCEKYRNKVAELSFDGKVLFVDEIYKGEVDETKIQLCKKCILNTDPAYVLFTSGSTGVPKGVIVSHQSVISYAEWVIDTFDISSEIVIGNQTPFYFSMSVLDIYATITAGCTLEIIPKYLFAKPDELMNYVISRNVNMIYWVPSALNLVANSRVLENKDVTNISRILFAGEVMPNKQLNIWRKNVPNAIYANLFGPTEVTDICTYYIVNRTFNDNDPLPIGFPCVNTDVFVLDNEDKQIVNNDALTVGELCVRGVQLAYGYYNNRKKTQEVFVQNPLNKAYPEIIYRTGDLVKYNELGELMYVGRKDSQIKVSGYRIELGEIETAVSAVKEIQANCCLFDEKRQLILCFYQGNIEKKELRIKIRQALPRYMMPHKYVKLEAIPLNANGKVDRGKLKSDFIENY